MAFALIRKARKIRRLAQVEFGSLPALREGAGKSQITKFMNQAIKIEEICAENGASDRTRAKRLPPQEVPRKNLQSTSQNPQERRLSLP
jgi:hypothetical protein